MNRECLWLWVLLLFDNIRCLTGGQKLIHYFKALCFLCNRRQMKNREYLNGNFDRNIVLGHGAGDFCFASKKAIWMKVDFFFSLRTFAKKKKKIHPITMVVENRCNGLHNNIIKAQRCRRGCSQKLLCFKLKAFLYLFFHVFRLQEFCSKHLTLLCCLYFICIR